MLKNQSKGLPSNEAVCKKIQNYIFKFTDLLGQGNFSKVYKAHHQITNQIVAVKIIELNSLKSQKLQELLFSEIDVLKKLNHPNILRCYEVFTSNRNCYIITEICNGGDLQTKLRKQHHFSQQSAQPIIKDVFSGLLYLAQRNVIHRDLKVANIFLHNGRGKIADFGFAKFTKQNFKDINIGSPIYMAPQGLINNIYGPKTDVWAFGIFLFELLHGQTPFAHCRTEAQLKYNISLPLNQKRLKPELSHQIKQIILLCLQIDESKRTNFEKLSNHPYFRSLMQKSPLRRMDSPGLDKKISGGSQKYINNSNQSKQILDKHNFLIPQKQMQNSHPTFSSNQQRQQQSSKYLAMKTKITDSRDNKSYSVNKKFVNGYGRQKQSYQFQSNNDYVGDQSPKKKSNHFYSGSSKLFSCMITFKQCVNILHYCRLIYKFVIFMRQSNFSDENTVKFFSGWVLTMMDEIKTKINQNGIKYQGENAWLREKKLREVTNQYTKKYQTELLSVKNSDCTLSIVQNHALSTFERLDSKIMLNGAESVDDNMLILGHYIVMIIEATNQIKQSYQEQNYKIIGNYKELEVFLNSKKQKMDLQSYKLLRKKKSFLH